MDDQILRAVSGSVYLNEMIPAAKGTKASLQTPCVFQLAETAQLSQVKTLLPPLPDVFAGRDEVRGGIQLCQINVDPAQIYGVHSAADIHAHDIGNNLIPYCHGSSNGAAPPCVNVGHDSYLASLGKRIVAHFANLFDCLVFDDLGVADCGIYFSLDFHHGNSPKVKHKKAACLNIRQAA